MIIPQPDAGGTFSCIANFRRILERSVHAFSGSASRAARALSGLSEKRVGTGPEVVSPSKRQHERGHSARRTVGTLSLWHDKGR